jgi:hypothetical protein
LLRDIYRKFIFLAGDVRREHCIGGFAVGSYEHLIDYEEALFSNLFGCEGYIGLHRNVGDLSNIALPGFMKHAWIYLGGHNIIESVSEGVINRNFLYPTMSDYVVILKPNVPIDAMQIAVERAKMMVGCPYDDKFKFDIEVVDELFKDKETALDNMKQFELGVSCSELVSLCYVGHRRALGLYRTKLGKREVILPDSFISTHFEIVWASKETKPEIAKELGLPEEGCKMIEEYWKGVK